MTLRAAEVEVLITANDKDLARADKNVKSTGERIEKKPIVAKVDADEKDALAGMDRVEQEAKKLVSERAVLKLDADIERAEKNLQRAVDKLEDLHVRAEGGLDVTADVKRAEANIQKLERHLSGLKSARTVVDIDADTAKAEDAIEGIADSAEDAGDSGGARGGKALVAGIVGALATIPIAGAVAKIAETAGNAVVEGFEAGLAIEARYDRLAGLTGLQEKDALRLGRAAGEAYANMFGDSIEANMDTTRLALQFDIIDEAATTRDAQKVVQGLSGIADALGEDVRPTALAVTTMLQTGLARSADHAFDILATGAREGVNRAEDLLDTMTEYPALFERLGLNGEEALGLINQGLGAGARNSDLVADALKELQIRSSDASEASAEGYRVIGLNAEEMTAKMAAGGASAREGLAQILDGLKSIEDPVARNAAGVALVGTQWEDLGDAILALDLSTAVDELNGVEGAAQRMFDTIADNSATKVAQAQRNIEVAAEGIQGALAAAFADPLEDFADWVSQNRGPVMEFFLDLANAALDVGDALIESAASGTESFGQFVSGPLATVLDGIGEMLNFLGQEDASNAVAEMVAGMREFEDTTSVTADSMRENLGGALDVAREKLNEFGEPAVALGYLNDASLRLATAIGDVGVAASDGKPLLDDFTVSQNGAVSASGELDAQIRNAIAAMEDEMTAAALAGESQDNLKDRYNNATGALRDQLKAMGLTEGQVDDLLERYGAIPDRVDTYVNAATAEAQAAVNNFIWANDGRRINLIVDGVAGRQVHGSDVIARAMGGIVEFMAGGGIRGSGLTPMQSIAQMVPPNTWRVVGDRGDVDEAYIPLDGSARSMSILLETMRRMLGDDPGTAGAPSPRSPRPSGPTVQVVQNGTYYSYDPHDIAREEREQLTRLLDTLA